MSILEGVKASNCKLDNKPKFIIKARANSNRERDEVVEPTGATDGEVIQLIEHMVTKSTRLH